MELIFLIHIIGILVLLLVFIVIDKPKYVHAKSKEVSVEVFDSEGKRIFVSSYFVCTKCNYILLSGNLK